MEEEVTADLNVIKEDLEDIQYNLDILQREVDYFRGSVTRLQQRVNKMLG